MATAPRGPVGKKTPLGAPVKGGQGVAIAASMTKPGMSHRRQKRMGPAPFASFEDLSDELESPEDKNASAVVRLPGIREDATPCSPAPSIGGGEIRAEFIYTGISLIGAPSTPTVSGRTPTMSAPGLQIGEQPKPTTLTPRIDISRASSSSHHDSKESTPEKEEVVKLGLEEGAVDLRSSTEELEFAGVVADASKRHTTRAPPPPPPPRVHSPHDQQLHEDSYHSHNRKDSQSSEIGLLCISGRTSRLSSIGSQGSAQSRVSNASHLSVVSGTSRSPSPHKMLLETSFCGTKGKRGNLTIELEGKEEEHEGTKELEKTLLQRQHDPTQVLIAEGVDITKTPQPQSPRSPMVIHQPEVDVVVVKKKPVTVSSEPTPKPKALSKPLDKVTIKIDKPSSMESTSGDDDVQRSKLPKHIVGGSGTEYIYIPLKGPLPEDPPGFKEVQETNGVHTKTKVRETKSASGVCAKDRTEREKRKSKSASPSPAMSRHYQAGPSHRSSADEPKYVRIRLKPEHMYEDYDPNAPKSEMQKPETLNLQSKFDEITVSPGHYQAPQTAKSRYLTKDSPKHKSPSPSLSRKSSFASLFKSRETISPESPTLPGRKQRTKESSTSHRRSRSRSKSRDRGGGPSSTESIDSKGKSMFSLFSKPRKTSSRQSLDRSPGPELPNLENLAQNIQNTSKSKRSHYESPLQGESVRIPLHSPTYYESKCFLESFKTSSQDSQETVIEVKTNINRDKDKDKELEKEKEIVKDEGISCSATCTSIRQSSTSSENIVFTTKLGSNNEIFSTKLPKHQEIIETTTAIVEYVKERVTSDDDDLLNQRPKTKSPERRMSTSASNDSRKFKLEKSRRVESTEQLVVTTCSSSYIPKCQSPQLLDLDAKQHVKHAEHVEPEPKPTTPQIKSSRDSSRERVMLKQQDSEDIPIIAKEKRKLAELKKSAEEHYSSESERESDFDRREKPSSSPQQQTETEEVLQEMEPERKGLVLQQDSFEDELPYIPTTLPQERSMAVPIIPVKQRASIDCKTCPIERPRSTTPIKPTLEVYRDPEKQPSNKMRVEKLKISLPRQDEQQPKVKSPRRKISEDVSFSAPVAGTSDWFDFSKVSAGTMEEPPPPLPPKGMPKEWINFEEIPEKRKPPKRIQTIPSRGNIEVPEALVQAQENVIYTYVNPEDCKCECHERPVMRQQPPPPPAPPPKHPRCPQHDEEEEMREDEMPLLDEDDDERDRLKPDRRSLISDSSMEHSTTSRQANVHEETANGTAAPPFTSDLGVSSNSNRSSIISQQDDQLD